MDYTDQRVITATQAAAEAGDAHSQYLMGWIFENGRGVRKNYPAASRWYMASAEQGYAPSQHRLGKMYLWGKGVKVDHDKTEYWLEKAALCGYGNAQIALGTHLLSKVLRFPLKKKGRNLPYYWFLKGEANGCRHWRNRLLRRIAGLFVSEEIRNSLKEQVDIFESEKRQNRNTPSNG